jgi:hypothetical protein
MLRKLLALAAVTVLVIGMGCSRGTDPTVPAKDTQASLEEFFNSFDLSSPVIGEYSYYDLEGNLLAQGKLGRDGDKLIVLESRGAQIDVPVISLGLVNCWVTYNNPAGTIPTGPNAGLPYYYIGQTVDYDINILSNFWTNIGGYNPPWGWAGPATVTAEMHYASFDQNNVIIPGGLMPGSPVYVWQGIISPGYQILNDTYYIPPGTVPGLDVTTVRIEAPVFLGIFDIIFFDGIAGIWDPS